MKKDDLKRWSAKNELLNKDIVPYLGMEVIDSDGFKGVLGSFAGSLGNLLPR